MGEAKPRELPLLKYLDGLVEDLRRLITKVPDAEASVVHDARVTTRRLKAALDLLDPILTGRNRKPFAKITRKVRKRLGPVRDLDVMCNHLDELKNPKAAAGAKWLAEKLGEARRQAEKKATGDLESSRVLGKLGCWWGVREEIAGGEEAIESLIAQSVHLQLDAFCEQADGLARSDDTRSDPHQLRIAGKSLRYTLELAREQGWKLPREMTAVFKRIQDALGLWHDYVVLAGRVLCESTEEQLALHNAEAQQAALDLAAITLHRGQKQLERVADLWQRRGEELASEIRKAFSLTSDVKLMIEPPPKEPSAPAA
ncbi:MAG TPA: CHAD domain-containing protein [Tepidisphaeraceae bacterium]|nr:CHAD domain-containing protein [Tepidisphaeraceae bacterium]